MAFYFNRLLERVCDFYFPEDDPDKSGKACFTDHKQLFPGCIIFAHPIFFYRFDFIAEIKVPFILITGKSDETIPFYSCNNVDDKGEKILANPNLIKWFANNIDYKHDKLTCVPIGLPRNIPWIGNDKSGIYMAWYRNYVSYDSDIVNFSYKNIIQPKIKLLYIRYDNKNNKEGVTMHQYHSIRDKWSDHMKLNGFEVLENLIPWKEYMTELIQYKFCLSPPGRGIDCFRTWEALNSGVIPIVLKTCDIMCEMYKDLPIVVIEDIKEVTKEFLENKFGEIMHKFNNNLYNFDKLKLEYWIISILKQKL